MEYYFILIVVFAGVTNAYINMARYKQQILNLHNNVRRMEPAANMQKMRWNTQLENEAAMWANNCMFDHQQRGRGENLAMHTAPWDYPRLIKTGITMWSDEKRLYTYGTSGFSQATGHYTQMVWADTTDVGCAMTRCPSLSMGGGSPMQNAWFLVCFYSPAGNFIGQLPFVSGQQCSQCGRGQYCDRGLCSSSPGTTSGTPPTGGMGGGGGAPSRNTGGGGAPTRNTGGGQQPGGGRQTGGGRQAGGNIPGSGSPFGQQNIGNKPSGNPMGGGGAPGGQMPSINMGGSPSPAGNNLGTIGGGPGMPSISFQNGFPMINIGNPPAGGGPSSKASTKPGTNAKPSKPSPSMNGLVSNTPGGSISIWGFQNSFSNKGGNSCKDPSWCRMWGELCADPKYSRKIARECPATCGKCGGGGGGRGGPSGGAGSTGGPACVDAIEGCVFWKQIGMCNVPFYQTYIAETCARTCNLC